MNWSVVCHWSGRPLLYQKMRFTYVTLLSFNINMSDWCALLIGELLHCTAPYYMSHSPIWNSICSCSDISYPLWSRKKMNTRLRKLLIAKFIEGNCNILLNSWSILTTKTSGSQKVTLQTCWSWLKHSTRYTFKSLPARMNWVNGNASGNT